MRLTKFNPETGMYEYVEKAKTQEQFNAQRKAVIQKLGEYEDKASEVAEEIFAEIEKHISSLEYQANTPRKTVKVEELKAQVNWVLHEVVPQTLAELKKKYTESEDTE